MKTVIITLLSLLIFCGNTLAVAPFNEVLIREAQEYGRINANIPLKQFLKPWTVYEEKAVIIADNTERVCIYTPFLLLALDAKMRILENKPVSINDSQKVLAEYLGYLIFEVSLFNPAPFFDTDIYATIKQGKNVIKASQAIMPQEPAADNTGGLYRWKCYFYFLEKDVRMDKPAMLLVKAADNKEYRFRFNLLKMK